MTGDRGDPEVTEKGGEDLVGAEDGGEDPGGD